MINLQQKVETNKLDPITPSSLSIMSLNPSEQSALYMPGDAPKVYRGKILEISNAFNQPKLDEKVSKKSYKSNLDDYHDGLSAMMKAQKGFDMRESQTIYHNLQFAMDHLEKISGEKSSIILFLIAQYIYETHSKVLTHILSEFKIIKDKLPENLVDHCNLFIYRLETILGINVSIKSEDIRHKNLRKFLNLNRKYQEQFSFDNEINDFAKSGYC